MFNEGHQIASHTWSHADLCAITSAQRKDEIYKLEMAVRNVVGVIPTYMRPPYSSCTAGMFLSFTYLPACLKFASTGRERGGFEVHG